MILCFQQQNNNYVNFQEKTTHCHLKNTLASCSLTETKPR